MKTISTSELPGLQFDFPAGTQEKTNVFRSQSNKLGWIQGKANKPGAKYDITIKDAAGRTRHQMKNCGSNESNQFGELVNMEAMVGEEFEVVVDNVRGAEKVDLFIN